MRNIAIVGSSPSSGSTFLADLLDSTNHSACGVELNLFSDKSFYNFQTYKKNIFQGSKTSYVYTKRNKINHQRLHAYGLDVIEYLDILRRSSDINIFLEKFSDYYFSLRGKHQDGIFFEKTPNNANCIGEFLDSFEHGYFIYVVRNPLYVYISLLKRGVPPYIALTTWLISIATYFQYRNHPRVILIKYEELIMKPFLTVSELLRKIGDLQIDEHTIEHEYKNNRYRKIFSKKISTWQVRKYGELFSNANDQVVDKGLCNHFSTLMNCKVSAGYSKIFGITQLAFIDAVHEFDYFHDLNSQIIKTESIPRKTWKDVDELLKKWLSDFKYGDTSLLDIKHYLNPVELIS